MSEEIKFYVVKNKEGFYFRAKGYSGYGSNWVKDMSKARVYGKKGYAESRAYYYAKNYPQFGVPEVIELTCTITDVFNQEQKVIEKQNNKEKIKKIQQVNKRKKHLEIAQRELEEAERKLKELET